MLLLLNEHGEPSFLSPNLSSYNINNQWAKFEKNLSVGSISVVHKLSHTPYILNLREPVIIPAGKVHISEWCGFPQGDRWP